MRGSWMALLSLLLVLSPMKAAGSGGAGISKPTSLLCDSLQNPLGIESKRPLLSWKLQDQRPGARQTAYRITVASTAKRAASMHPDIWDSGPVASNRSVGIPYSGPDLAREKRYFWRVQVWDQDGRSSPPSEIHHWEMGLMGTQHWRGKWIGSETPELRRVREADAAWISHPLIAGFQQAGDTHHAFRLGFELPGTPRRGALYVTGQDAAAAWVNGRSVLEAQPLPLWRQSPWKTYTRVDVSPELRAGKNLLAIQVTVYAKPQSNPPLNASQTPMNATLFVELEDGSFKVFRTGDVGWRAVLNTPGNWFAPGYEDSGWGLPVPIASGVDGSLGKPWPTGPVQNLRRAFMVHKPVRSARLYATALGAYRCSLNGRIIGDQVLAPGWMDFRQRVPYQVYDVTSMIRTGANALGASLAPGWYSTPLEWFRQGNNYGHTPPALKAQLRLEHTDGSVDWIMTDESWKAVESPIRSAEIYDGETLDARMIQAGWDTASFNEDHWRPVTLIQPLEPEIIAQDFQPIRAHQVIAAKGLTNPSPGVFIFDFGQNLAGVARLRAQGPAGTDVKLRFAEVLHPDGTLSTENLRNAKATDHFILAGRGVEEYQPTFTYHGFRYVEVSGLPSRPGLGDVKAVVYHTDAPLATHLQTGSPMVNQLWSNILWGQRSNFVGIPSDCPQRDERLGWCGDAQVFWRTAAYNMDLTAFSRKFSMDLRGTQGENAMYGIYAPGTLTSTSSFATGWSDAGVIVPWTSWIQSGDTRILQQNWEAMEKYLAAIQSTNPDALWKHNSGIGFGDWLAPEGETPVDLIATAYWAYDAKLMSQMARALARTADEQKYQELFLRIQKAFTQTYTKPDGFVGGVETSLGGKRVETQTGYVLALHMDLLPESLRPAAASRLVDRIAANDGRLATGFLGTPYLLSVLTDTGHADLAYQLLLSTRYPSWGYLVEHGATTMWERWNADQMQNDPSMNSYNHYAYGAVADWIYRFAAGVDATPLDAGFHTVALDPHFDARLGKIALDYQSSYGPIHSDWNVAGATAEWHVTLPANTTGWLSLSAAEAARYKVDGIVLTASKQARAATHGGISGYELAAGSYSFEVTLK